jgi:DNA-binding transcriptional ArsR family regulator
MITEEVNLIPMSRLEKAAGVMRVLAHPHRLRICELLMNGRVPVKAIAEHLAIPRNAASQHLNMMKAHGILACRRHGKTVFYEVVDPQPAWLLGCIRNHSGPIAPPVLTSADPSQ